jgi:hypothetical protein
VLHHKSVELVSDRTVLLCAWLEVLAAKAQAVLSMSPYQIFVNPHYLVVMSVLKLPAHSLIFLA